MPADHVSEPLRGHGTSPTRREWLAAGNVDDHRLDVAGVTTAYLEAGSGDPIVLLHGQGGFGGMFLPVIAELAAEHRVIAPDLPGLGASTVDVERLDGALVLVRVPTTLVWGRHGPVVPVTDAEAVSVRHGWPLHVIEQAGHVPHVEQTPAFLAALSDALAR